VTIRELVDGVAGRTGWPRDASGAGLSVPVGQDRQQTIFFQEFKDGHDAVARLWTRIGSISALNEKRLAASLQVNFRLPYGCLAIDRDTLVLTDTHKLEGWTAPEAAATAEYLARQADLYEKFIYGTDAH
jgi:hypothetical protein